MTVVHDYILAFILLIHHLKISSSSHGLRAPETVFPSSGKLCQGLLNPLFNCFISQIRKRSAKTQMLKIEQFLTTLVEKWYLLIYFPFKISLSFCSFSSNLLLSPQVLIWTILPQTPSQLFWKIQTTEKSKEQYSENAYFHQVLTAANILAHLLSLPTCLSLSCYLPSISEDRGDAYRNTPSYSEPSEMCNRHWAISNLTYQQGISSVWRYLPYNHCYTWSNILYLFKFP